MELLQTHTTVNHDKQFQSKSLNKRFKFKSISNLDNNTKTKPDKTR